MMLPLPITPHSVCTLSLNHGRCNLHKHRSNRLVYVCRTNDSKAMEHLYGRNICGVFGCKSALPHLTVKCLWAGI